MASAAARSPPQTQKNAQAGGQSDEPLSPPLVLLGTDAVETVDELAGAEVSASGATELDRRANDFVRNVVAKQRALQEQYFKGDTLAESVFQQAGIETRWLINVELVGGDDESARVALANKLLRRHVLRPAPRFDIIVDHRRDDGDAVTFAKVLFNGWHVKIEEDEFVCLAYGDAESAVSSAPDCSNLHSLCVRGNLLDPEAFGTNRARLVLAVADAAVRAARLAERHERKRASEERAREMRLGASDCHAVGAETLREHTTLRNLQVSLRGGQAEPMSIAANDGERVAVLLDKDLSTNDLVATLRRVSIKVADKNLARIRRAYAQRLKRISFKEKIDYWRALRSSDGATQKLLLKLFDTCLRGGDDVVFESAQSLAQSYRKTYRDAPVELVARRLLQWQASNSLSTGFVSGFGGFVTMAVTIPAGLLAAWLTSARLSFAIAHLYGHDVFSPAVCCAVLYALAGTTGSAPNNDPVPGETQAQTSEKELQARLCETMRTRRGGCTGLEAETALVAAATEPPCDDDGSGPACLELEPAVSSDEFAKRYETLYDLLQVERTASVAEIRTAFRKLALRCHPDKVQDASPEQLERAKERFQIIIAAYETLAEPASRREYDAKLAKGSWRWDQLAWNKGIGTAKDAFKRYCAKDHHDVSKHMASKAMTQVTVNVVEEIASKSAARTFATAELRSSIVAGEKLAAQASARSGSKMIPFLGALVSGAIDCATTASVGRAASRVFACGDLALPSPAPGQASGPPRG